MISVLGVIEYVKSAWLTLGLFIVTESDGILLVTAFKASALRLCPKTLVARVLQPTANARQNNRFLSIPERCDFGRHWVDSGLDLPLSEFFALALLATLLSAAMEHSCGHRVHYLVLG